MVLSRLRRNTMEIKISFVTGKNCPIFLSYFIYIQYSKDIFTANTNFVFCLVLVFCSKIEILFKNRNLVQKSKFCSKIKILFKNRNFIQKSKFCSKIEILFKNRNFVQKSKFYSKIEILIFSQNFHF